MTARSCFLPGVCFALCGAALLAIPQESAPRLTPRELFYTAAAPMDGKKGDTKKENTSKAGKTTTKKGGAATQNAGNGTLPGGAQVIPTALAPTSGTPLGLKYEIRKATPAGMASVNENTVFHTGDAIDLRIETNTPGYLYIINRGSSGAWNPMFPSPELEGGSNRVEAHRAYNMPPRRMVFDEQTGVESVTIVFSREAVDDLDKLIYSLQKGAPDRTPKALVADAKIDEKTVGRLRQTYSRDLIIEPVTSPQETATYVVNPSGSPASRMLWEFKLTHR